MTTASMVIGWRKQYMEKYGVRGDVLTMFGDDIAHAMLTLVEKGRSPREAYKIITNGLYAEERAIAANKGRRRKRASRRNKRTSRRSKRTSRKRSSR